jgi:hypothetical protein
MARLLLIGPFLAEPDLEPASPALVKATDALTPSDLALLVLLVRHRGAHRRQALIEAMWPENEDWEIDFEAHLRDSESAKRVKDAAANLHTAVSRLTKFVGELVPDEDPTQIIRKTRAQPNQPGTGTVSFLPSDSMYVDLYELASCEQKDPLRCLEITRGQLVRETSHPYLTDERHRQREGILKAIAKLLPTVNHATATQLAHDVFHYGDHNRVESMLARRNGRQGSSPYPAPSELAPSLDPDALTATATATLAELLASWIGDARFVHREGHALVHATCPSLWVDVPAIEMTFVVFTHDATRREVRTIPELAEECLIVPARSSTIDSLSDYVEEHEHVYFVVAVPRQSHASPTALGDLPPQDRFEWLAVEGAQLLRSGIELNDEITFPVENRWNLAQFSLLWSARWVESFFNPLADPLVTEIAELSRLTNHVFPVDHTQGRTGRKHERGWKTLTDDLPSFAPHLDPELFRRVNFRLGLGVALDLIHDQMGKAAGKLDQIRNYCPESLFGTASLWLFSRVYRRFMEQSAHVGRGKRDFLNQRLLPITFHELDSAPRLFLSTLWHVVVAYRVLGADVRLVDGPIEHAGEDHSYYGGGIGYFPWISMTPDQASWEIGNETRGDLSVHLDFLNDHAGRSVLGSHMGEREVSELFAIPVSQLLLGHKPPSLLFPPESAYVQYPVSLWGQVGQSSKLRGPN